MKLHTFQDLVSRIVNLSTRDKKRLSITWSGTDAYTNTKSVNLPTLPAGTILTPHQFSIWMGYAIHEGPGHQTHTDLNLYENACLQRNNKQFSYILNLLEDIRIENADINLYPGDRKYLDTVHSFVDSKIPISMAQTPDIMGLIYKHLFTHHRNLDTNIIKGNLDSATAKIISKIDLCFSTQDCVILADEIIDYLKQKQQEQKEQNQEQEQKQNENNSSSPPQAGGVNDKNESEKEEDNLGDKNAGKRDEENHNPADKAGGSKFNEEKDQKENQSEGNKDEENKDRKDSEGTGSDATGNTDSNDLGNESETRTENEGNGSKEIQFPTDSTADIWQKITEIKNIVQYLKDQIETKTLSPNPDQNLNKKSIFPPQNISFDRIYVPSDENITTYNSTRTQCTSQILALKKMFRIYLQAKTTKSTIRGLEEGKLDFQRLHIVSTGSTTIFKDQSTKFLPETAIELMIDLSGSMDASIARTAAIILSESLNSIPQIKLSISGFTTNHHGRNHWENISPNSGRQNGMDILQFKNFTEPYTKCKAKLGAITNSGLTPLGDAYGHALEHIIFRPENRKIIFLITDGRPEFSHGKNHSDFLLMKKIHFTAKKYNIQTLGLGIGANTNFLSSYFDKSINITETETLPKNLLEGLKFFI